MTAPGLRARRREPGLSEVRDEPVRVLSVPPRHPYVDAVLPTSSAAVRLDRVVGWEPDPFFDPAVVAARADEVDVVHLHFGYDHLDVAGVRAWLAALDAADLPLVLTVHDLRNPHHLQRDRHDAVLGLLVPAAAAVLTLTAGAAAELRARFGCEAVVVPHPTLVDPARTADVATEPGRVVVHLKSLRTNVVDPYAVVAAVREGAVRAGGRVVVDLHPGALDDPRLTGLPELAATAPGLELQVHERFDHLALERYLRRAHVTVLPYRWGTHSGWLELARDLGTRVVAPSCGHYAEQWDDVVTYGYDEERGLDAAGLADAVADAVARPAPEPAERAERLAEAAAVRDAHAETYAALRRPRVAEVGR